MASTYLKAAALTLALTCLGFFFISQLDAMRAAELRASIEDLMFQSETERLLFLYEQAMGNSSQGFCDYLSDVQSQRANRAYELSQKIAYYEKSNVLNSEYERIRGQYYQANAALYLNLRAAEKYCGTSPYSTVLFFYRITPDCPECRAQGGVLDNLRKEYPDMRVFAFPIGTNYAFINVLAGRHNVTAAPALVIDDNYVLSGLKSEDEVAPYLGSGQKV
jgi:hypothetical protein